MLSMAVAWSSFSVVAICDVLPVFWMTSGFSSTMGRIAVSISLQKTDFAQIYLVTKKSDRIQFSVIKGHNFD